MSGGGPVIAIAGPPGAGKSTLAARLLPRLRGAVLVDWDAYETFTRQPPEAVAAWLADGAPADAVKAPGLVSRLVAARAEGPVLFEAPLGRAHPETGPLIDHLIWLDLPADLALARKLVQLVAETPGGTAAWLPAYLDAYLRITRPAMAMQIERARSGADRFLDSSRDPETLASDALAGLRLLRDR